MKYEIVSPVRVAGKDLKPGDKIELDHKSAHAQALTRFKQAKPVSEGPTSTATAPAKEKPAK